MTDTLAKLVQYDGPTPPGAVVPPLEDVPMDDVEAPSNDQRESRLLMQLRQKFSWFKQERAGMEVIWDECYRMYRAQTPDTRKSGDWRSRVHIPYAFVNVEDVTPHLMAGIFDAEKPFRITSRVAPVLAQAHERLALHQWNELAQVELVWEEFQKMKAMLGTSAVYTGFKSVFEKQKKWEIKQSADGTESAPVVGEHIVPVYVGNFLEPIHIYNLYVHPRATITNLKSVFWVHYRTLDWLKDQGHFKNLNKLQPSMAVAGNIGDSFQAQAQVFGEMRSSFPSGEGADDNPEYRVVSYFDDESRQVMTMCGQEGSEILIGEGDYPFWHNKCPIVFDRYTLVPREFYGVGVVEPSIALMHEGNMIRNQRRDNVTLAMNMVFEVKENAIDDEEAEMVSRPGAIVHSADGNSVRAIPYPDVTSAGMNEERVVASDIRDITGLGGPLSGQTDPNSPSGTKFSLQQKGQLMRLSRAIRREALVVKEVVSQWVSNNAQFYPVAQIRDVLGPQMFEDYQQIQPEIVTMRALVTVEPVGVYANEDVMRQQYTNFINVMAMNPLFADKLDPNQVLLVGLKQYETVIGDPYKMLKQRPQIDVMSAMEAVSENTMMAEGQMPPAATPDQDGQVHLAHHDEFLARRPDMAQIVLGHIATHKRADELRDFMATQGEMMSGGMGPGSPPSGNGGGVNPARQPAPTSERSITGSGARQQNRSLS